MRRFLCLALICAAIAFPARADEIQRVDALVPMSDGVRLDATLYLPAVAGRVPLVVRHHGGGSHKDNAYDLGYGLDAVEAGFALLMYSHRGHGRSEGSFDFFGSRTTRDFSEMVDWVAAVAGQRVDTGSVGVSGYSQGGGESLLPAAADPRVRVVAVGNTFSDLNEALNPNDCFKFSFATGIFALAYKVPGARTDDSLAIRWGSQLYTDTEDTGAPGVPSTTADLHARSPRTYVQSLIDRRVPVFWTQSWEDQLFPGSMPEQVLEPLRAAGVPVHYWFSSGGHAAGPNFPADETAKEAAIVAWFDQYLRGNDRGFGSGHTVDFWERMTPGLPGQWTHHTAPSWPVAPADDRLYLRNDGSLRPEPHAVHPTSVGTIVNDLVSANTANDPIAFELATHAPPLGGVLDPLPESANPLDTATFSTGPLAAPLRFVGAPRVHVEFTTTARRVVQFAAKVWDVSDDGAQLVSRGCYSYEKDALASPIDRLDAPFDLWPNAHTFAPGHRMVLTISAVDFPTFKPDTEPHAAQILSGSHIALPVVS